jgi:hypothetical protein
MNKYWLEMRPTAANLGEVEGKWYVRYSTPGLGFTVDETVDDKTAHIIQVAIEHGKELAKAEVRRVLGI